MKKIIFLIIAITFTTVSCTKDASIYGKKKSSIKGKAHAGMHDRGGKAVWFNHRR